MKRSGFSLLYIPHGGGPLPLMGHSGHTHLIEFLQTIALKLTQPQAIVVISAHWEEKIPTLTAGAAPRLIYDYYGFPSQAYEIEYPAPGSPALAGEIHRLLKKQGVISRLDDQRGFDHGMFVPLKLMYPDAKIPCVQLSLMKNLNPADHVNLGRALSELNKENILVLGSGFSFHNMKAFGDPLPDLKNEAFDQWLLETLTDESLTSSKRERRMIHWEKAPHARYCHPREEHLLPLLVCAGMARMSAQVVFHKQVLGKKALSFLWQG